MRLPRPHRDGWGAGFLGLLLLLVALPNGVVSHFLTWPAALAAPWLLARCAIRARSGADAFGRLLLLGLLLMLLGAWWIAETLLLNLLVVAAVEAPLVGLFGWLAWRTLRSGPVFPWLPVLWTAHEMVRISWPETGFGWLFVGHALAASPLLVQVADLGGVLAVSFVGASASAALMAQVERRPGRLPAALLVLAAALYGAIRPHTLVEPEPGPRLAAIQPGFPQELKNDPLAVGERWRICFDLAREVAAAGEAPDLLVFPETMWPWGMLVDLRQQPGMHAAPNGGTGGDAVDRALDGARADEQAAIDALLSLFPGGSTRLLLGTFAWGLDDPGLLERPLHEWPQLNTAVLVDGQGRRVGRYDKHILIPGGEMIPFRDLMPDAFREWLDAFLRRVAGFLPILRPGPGPEVLQHDGLPFGVTICFENAYGGYNRRLVKAGARFLVNLSNEGWFGTSPEFDHMELHSILRAVETRRALFRATNTGVSSLVRPDGRPPRGADRLVVGGRDRAVAGTFAARVPLHRDVAPYVWWGDLLGWLCLLATALQEVLRRRFCIP